MGNNRSFKDGFDAGVKAFTDVVSKTLDRSNDDSVVKNTNDAMKDLQDKLDD